KEQIRKISGEIEKQNRKISEQHAELLQQHEISSQFETLVNQLNPHILFNSLNTLSSLVQTDTEKSVKFIENFSDTYRYILQIKDEVLVPLEKEINFVNAYCFMQQIRHNGHLNIFIDPIDFKEYLIPPFTIQVIIENAITNNEISESKPLRVSIHNNAGNNQIIIRYPLQEIKVDNDLSNQSLINLQKRFKLIMQQEPEIITDERFFEIRVPLIINERYNLSSIAP
ncbi:MAG: histidine kinase, partial [Bacteroidales bacterium]|nr:histidine kinase [Bacteroidales bacterium]